MKIGIFVHSQSGNTAKLGLAVTHALREKGHEVSVELLRPFGKVSLWSRNVRFRTMPEPDEFDILLLGGPNWAFGSSPVIVSLLRQLETLKGKKTLFFITSLLPDSLSGAQRGIAKVNGLCEGLGAKVLPGVTVAWGLYCGKKRLDKTVDEICKKILTAV
jgi:NAD(P)H dehydrogenase (quinone)